MQSAVSDTTTSARAGQLVEQPGLGDVRLDPPHAGEPALELVEVRSTATISAPGGRASRGTRCEPTKPPAPSTAIRRGPAGKARGRAATVRRRWLGPERMRPWHLTTPRPG